MKRALLAIPSIIALACAAPASAQWQYSFDAGARYVRMTEKGPDGHELVRERGWLPGVGFGADYRTGEWRMGAAAEVFDGRIDYDGELQSGAAFASRTDTTQVRLRLEAGRKIGEATELVAGLEHDMWRRAIQGSGSVIGITERYRSWRLLAGAKSRLLQWDAGRLDGSAMLVMSSPERMRVQFGRNLLDDARLRTRSATGVRLGLSFQPNAMPSMSVEAGLDWIDIRRSRDEQVTRGGVVAGTIAQPRHERLAADLRIRYRF